MVKTLGERIKYLRTNKGLTQTELGDKFGVTKTAVSNWEKNFREPNIETIDKLSKIFNVSVGYLINGNQSKELSQDQLTLGARIKNLRKQNKLSQEALANLIGVNVQNVYRYEKGIITDLPISRIDKLAQALNTTTEYLINGNIYKHDMTSIGERIKYLRKNKALTLEQLAEIFSNRHNSNIHKSMISNWENNKVQPSIYSLNMYTSYFNASLDWIMGTNSILPEPIIKNLGIEIVPKIETINEVDYVSSRTIAEQLGKRHTHVLESIENIIKNNSTEISAQFFINSTYKDNSGKSNKEYLLTRDGFTLYMFNIQGYNDFKIAYIKRFNEMEKELLQSVREDYYRLKRMNFKRELLDKILRCEVTPNDFKEWQHILFENDLSEKLIACEIRNRERVNARGNKIRNIILEFETVDDPMVQLAPGFEAGDFIL